jgi:hypothetical protein
MNCAVGTIKWHWMGACGMYGERSGAYTILVVKLKGKYHLEDLGVEGRIILKRVFNR